MRVFIFGIGGTGARVLRSLTMLLASGVKLNYPDLTIVPIVIDTDAHNGDTTRTRDLLRSYYKIRKNFVSKTVTSQSDMFFNTQIRSFNRLEQNAADSADLDVQLNFQNQDNSFANFINYNSLSQLNKDVIELLYSDSVDTHRELHLNLSVGFKGNPNIGSVVFNDLMYSPQYKNLESSFTQNDRLFIVSSIFGGTGSSGFPTLVKLFRTSRNPNLANAKIGALTVMPYFNVETSDKSSINSAYFNTKTKAALSFYASDSHISSINALYYIADHNQAGNLPNVEGGEEQVNNGHVVELISATSILDFINKNDNDLESPRCFEFGAESNGNPFTIAHFSEDTKKQYIEPLTRFAYASKIATGFIPELTKETFYKDLNIDNAMEMPNEYEAALNFFREFQNWTAKEMSSTGNGRAFNSYDYAAEDHLNIMVQGRHVETGFFDKGLSRKFVSEILTRTEVAEERDLPKAEKYLSILYKTADACLKKLGQLP